MNWLQLYYHLPYPLRVLAASTRGYYLNRWRYGPETEQLVEEALEREQWSPQKWKTWQEERLAFTLHRAATQVPYYHDQWLSRRRKGDKASWDYLENWPILHKESVRKNEQAFLVEDCDARNMFPEHTSGTTGKPLDIWVGRDSNLKWYSLNEARVKFWNGVSRNDRWAILGGQLVASFTHSRPPFWVWNAASNQLYMSSYHLSMEFGAAYIEALHHYKITYLLGYPSSMYSLALIASECNLSSPKLRVAISNAETLYQHQRELISEVFQCPTVDTYGMVELVAAASECNKGSLHLWPEVGIIEVMHLDDDIALTDGENGRFICTGLINNDMPLIRYEVGDYGALHAADQKCSCDRTLPRIKDIEGRIDDVIITPDGRRVGRLSPVFKGDVFIHEAQVIQEDQEHLRILLVPAPGYSSSTDNIITQRLQDRLGNMHLEFELVDHIPRSANGKFREIVSNLNKI